MASSSQEGVERTPSLLSFYAIVKEQVCANQMNRFARAAELSERAAAHADTLFQPDSLVSASLRVELCVSLFRVAVTSSDAEVVALIRRVADVLLPVTALLWRRIERNTILPFTVREDEVAYYIQKDRYARENMNLPVPHDAVLRASVSQRVGYDVTIVVALRCLELVRIEHRTVLRSTEIERFESFVLAALDLIPLTGNLRFKCAEDTALAAHMALCKSESYRPAFYAAVMRKWQSAAVSNALRDRGVLDSPVEEQTRTTAEFNARQRADIEKIGLRECAWPSCDKVEHSVHEFKQCSGCRSVWYCGPEHHRLDWGAHRHVCGELDAARKKAARDAAKQGRG